MRHPTAQALVIALVPTLAACARGMSFSPDVLPSFGLSDVTLPALDASTVDRPPVGRPDARTRPDLRAADAPIPPDAGRVPDERIDASPRADAVRRVDAVPAPDSRLAADARRADSPVAIDASLCFPVLNELQATGMTASDEWVELYNPCPLAVDLTGWRLAYRSASNNAGGASLTLYAFSQTISAGGYLLIAGSGYSGTVTPDGMWTSGGLAGAGGAVGLLDAGGQVVDSLAYQSLKAPNDYTEGAPAPNPPALQSIARTPNGADSRDNAVDFQVTSVPTPRAPNP